MEEKRQMSLTEGGRPRLAFLGASLLVLSLLLSACVATIIYMSISPATCQTPADRQENAIIDDAHLNLKNEDGSEVSEDIQYDEDRDVALHHGPDGSFTATDYEKGLKVIKDIYTGDCYVTPISTNTTAGQALKNFVKEYDGQDIEVEGGVTYKTAVLPGAIEDTSFLPPEAEAECGNFYWLSVVGEETAEERAQRKKRDICVHRIRHYEHVCSIEIGSCRIDIYEHTRTDYIIDFGCK